MVQEVELASMNEYPEFKSQFHTEKHVWEKQEMELLSRTGSSVDVWGW
jgi:hypothetical protein